jgi:uncharacterized membrane protein YeaQ/YmgE (transglycosylase-associated protein family)
MLLNIILWVVLGLIAGWLASMIMGRGGYGVIGDIIVGLIGAVIGGWLAAALGLGGLNANDPISWGSLIIAVLGAIILIAILRLISGSRSRV